jgi:hypothetical protein
MAVVERGMRLFPSLPNEFRPDAPRGEPVRRVRRYPAESPRQLMRLACALALTAPPATDYDARFPRTREPRQELLK